MISTGRGLPWGSPQQLPGPTHSNFPSPIDLAAKQMCLDGMARALALTRDGYESSTISRLGHCFCLRAEVHGKPHAVCCKCHDRYVVEPDPA